MVVTMPTPVTPQKVDAWVDYPHYLDHLGPIWLALPEEVRGFLYVHTSIAKQAEEMGLPKVVPVQQLTVKQLHLTPRRPILTAAWGGVAKWMKTKRPIILLNHGAGQSYNTRHPGFSGGKGRETVGLFLEPGPNAAEATRKQYPEAMVVETGCAKLDKWHDGTKSRERGGRPVVCVSTHWECRVAPESRSAWPEYRDAILALAKRDDIELVLHSHPLIADKIRAEAADAGIEYIETFDEVLERADLYVCDNSSTIYEFASTGRPILAYNASWYRRDEHHGLRFWDAVPGLQCDSPATLDNMIEKALKDGPAARKLRAHGLSRAYAACDGKAAHRAAQGILAFLRGPGR